MKKIIKELFFLIYDFIFTVGFILYFPVYLFRKKITFSSLRQRLGFFPFGSGKPVWIHAVSVGEVNLVGPVIRKLIEEQGQEVILSTTTLTGRRVAGKKYSRMAKIIYFPLDISFIIKRFLRRINPKILIAAETELWPNLIYQLNKRKIPFAVVNGRISRRAFARYRIFRFFLRSVLSGCSYIGVQSQEQKMRFLHLGAEKDKVFVSGNFKFSSIRPDKRKLEEIKKRYLPLLKPGPRLLFTAASTHNPEERIIIEIYRQLGWEGRVCLLIAPRHPERAKGIERMVAKEGFEPVPLSRAKAKNYGNNAVFILDTVGQLLYFYAISDICFVGGSLVPYGGHNILEPVFFQKPTLFGPSMDNFAEIARTVTDNYAGIQVRGRRQLKDELAELAKSKDRRLAYARACRRVFGRVQDPGETIDYILKQTGAAYEP